MRYLQYLTHALSRQTTCILPQGSVFQSWFLQIWQQQNPEHTLPYILYCIRFKQVPSEAYRNIVELGFELMRMVYESQLSFTLDIICPWTYLAKKRLDEALRQFRQLPASNEVNFTVKFFPYQLYPDASKEGEDKYEWYKRAKYNDSEEKMQKYTTLMAAYGKDAGIDFNFQGTVANTIDAHRLIQYCQETKGPEAANKVVDSLYAQYFTAAAHPSSYDTLLKAALDANIPQQDAEAFISDEFEGLAETRMLIREQASNGVDSVPYITIEGKRRDFTLEGAKEVAEYVKALEGVAKEAY